MTKSLPAPGALPASFPPRRTAPFEAEPGYHAPSGLWLYGNVRTLLGRLAIVPAACGRSDHSPKELEEIRAAADDLVTGGSILACGIHSPAHRLAATVPLKWGSPRILVLSGGFSRHLGPDLAEEPFPEARLWRRGFDPLTDLVVSRRAPDRLPTFSSVNRTVDRLLLRLASGTVEGELFGNPVRAQPSPGRGAYVK